MSERNDGSLFAPIFVPEDLAEATGRTAWLRAMLDAEAALAKAEANAGVIPPEAAGKIAAACKEENFSSRDVDEIVRAAKDYGNPVPPLVAALTKKVAKSSEEAAKHVHRGATSQDIVDTAAMLVTRRVLGSISEDLGTLAAACAKLARRHRDTPIAGRTLMQQALPTTFGLKAAGWLTEVLEVKGNVSETRRSLAAQLGGAAGTLASLGGNGPDVLREFALETGLAEPVVPWHTGRSRIVGIGGALAMVAGVSEKIATDVILLSQTEVGEVAEPPGSSSRRGGSSTLPHKRNPVLSVAARASARRVYALCGVLIASMGQEHERAAGAWHAEWDTLSDALALAGGSVRAMLEVTEGLEVYPDRMRENLDLTGGLLLAENVTTRLANSLGRMEAHELVREACDRTHGGGTLVAELLADEKIAGALEKEEIEAALDPANYLGCAGAFVDRALESYENHENHERETR